MDSVIGSSISMLCDYLRRKGSEGFVEGGSDGWEGKEEVAGLGVFGSLDENARVREGILLPSDDLPPFPAPLRKATTKQV